MPLVALLLLIVWRLGLNHAAALKAAQGQAARKNAPVSVAAVPAAVRDIVETYSAVGNVESPLNVKVAPKVTGRVAAILSAGR